MILRALLAVTVSLAVFGYDIGEAHAQDASEWQLKQINFTSYGTRITREYRDKVVPIEVLHSKGSAGGVGDVAFVCAYGSLNFRVQVVPGDIFQSIYDNIDNAFEGKANPRRTFRPEILMNGEKSKKAKWIEGKQDRVVMPLEFKTTAQLYNTVIKGGEVRFTRKKKTMILNLPTPNSDFKEFGESCLRKKGK